jgi:hypothetical protein
VTQEGSSGQMNCTSSWVPCWSAWGCRPSEDRQAPLCLSSSSLPQSGWSTQPLIQNWCAALIAQATEWVATSTGQTYAVLLQTQAKQKEHWWKINSCVF